VRLLLGLVDFRPRRAHGGCVFGGLGGGALQALGGQLARPSVASYRWRNTFRNGLKKTPFK